MWMELNYSWNTTLLYTAEFHLLYYLPLQHLALSNIYDTTQLNVDQDLTIKNQNFL